MYSMYWKYNVGNAVIIFPCTQWGALYQKTVEITDDILIAFFFLVFIPVQSTLRAVS
jgi:hypothetical protein